MKTVVCVLGTRPDALKMVPIIKRLQTDKKLKVICINTGQHKELLENVTDIFPLKFDYDLEVMTQGRKLHVLTSRLIEKLYIAIQSISPSLIIAQGDTTSTFCAALVSFYLQIPFAHVEAGLRTHKRYSPFPEELNRQIISRLATLHFAPTQGNRNNLIAEGIKENIYITGNTIIDTLNAIELEVVSDDVKPSGQKLILVTAHRTGNINFIINDLPAILIDIVKQHSDVRIVFPLHLRPELQSLRTKLEKTERINIISPLDYRKMISLIESAYLVITDSGGLQEECLALGKPLIVLKDVTSRIEGVEKGGLVIADNDKEAIIELVNQLVLDKERYHKMTRVGSLYGDGHAAKRIVKHIYDFLK